MRWPERCLLALAVAITAAQAIQFIAWAAS